MYVFCTSNAETSSWEQSEEGDTHTMSSVHFNPGSDSGVNGWDGSFVAASLLSFNPFIPFVKIWSCLCCLVLETLQRWRMPRWRLTMERMRAWCQTRCTSKFIHFWTADDAANLIPRITVCSLLLLQQYTEEDNAVCHVLWVSVSVCLSEGCLDDCLSW